MTTKENPPKLSTSVFNSFVAGAFSGTCSTILLQPLDLIKTRVQQSPKSTLWSISRDIIKTDGLRGFWTGVTPSLWRTVPGIGLHFSCYHVLTSHVTRDTCHLTSAQSLVIGMVSRVFAGTVLIPFTVVKTRWEAGGDMFRYQGQGMVSAIRSIVQLEGARGLGSGLIPTIVRDAPYSGIYLLFYNKLKQMSSVSELPAGTDKSLLLFLCGVVAGAGASVVVQPADVVKTEMQLRPQRLSHLEIVKIVYNDRGIPGFFTGLLPRIIRKSLMSALAWTVYERVTDKIIVKL